MFGQMIAQLIQIDVEVEPLNPLARSPRFSLQVCHATLPSYSWMTFAESACTFVSSERAPSYGAALPQQPCQALKPRLMWLDFADLRGLFGLAGDDVPHPAHSGVP